MKNYHQDHLGTAVVATSGVPIAAPAAAHTTYYAHHHPITGAPIYAPQVLPPFVALRPGKVAGGVAGAVIGSKVLGGGLLGAAAGAVGGVVAGGAIDRSMTATSPLLLSLAGERARSMPAYAQHRNIVRPRERAYALAAVVLVQVGARASSCCAAFTSMSRGPATSSSD